MIFDRPINDFLHNVEFSFLACPKSFDPAQNSFEPIEGRGMKLFRNFFIGFDNIKRISFLPIFTNHFKEMVFCYQNCSDLLSEKKFLVIENFFWDH